ncbi:MAG: hypothetical protein QX189_10955 [Methylococcales bacterium]
MSRKAQAIEKSRELIKDDSFNARNRKSENMFTRIRCLPFELVLIMILRKSTKSLQCIVNETVISLGMEGVTASAYSQARYKLKHTAFIELNQKAIIDVVYQDQDFTLKGTSKKFWGQRILAVDGSKIRLPNTEEICAEFGTIAYSQGEYSDVQGEHPYALGFTTIKLSISAFKNTVFSPAYGNLIKRWPMIFYGANSCLFGSNMGFVEITQSTFQSIHRWPCYSSTE